MSKKKVIKLALTHNSTLSPDEPAWSVVMDDRSKLPFTAFVFEDPEASEDTKTTWRYPHHWVDAPGELNEEGIYTSGDLYLHKAGLNAAWAAAMGARTGDKANEQIIAHLRAHREALGITEDTEMLKDGSGKAHLQDWQITDKPIFTLTEVMNTLNREFDLGPTVYIIGDIVKTGQSSTLELHVASNNPESGGNLIGAKLKEVFPENMRDRISIESYGYAQNPPWLNYKGILKKQLVPYDGSTVITTPEPNEPTVMPISEPALTGLFKNAKPYIEPAEKIFNFTEKSQTSKRVRISGTGSITLAQKMNNMWVLRFSGVGMCPGEWNRLNFTAEALEASHPFWRGISLVINHEDEKDFQTKVIGQVLSAWWDDDNQELWVMGEVTDKDMITIMNNGFMPPMSVGTDVLVDENNNVLDMIPFHLALLISYDPACPKAGVRNIITPEEE